VLERVSVHTVPIGYLPRNAQMSCRCQSRSIVAAVLAASGACRGQVSGPLVAFGQNTFGQLSVPSDNFIAVSCGGITAAGIRADGTLVVWGEPDPIMLNAPSGTFKQISGGGAFYLAIRTDYTVAGWGYNVGGAAVPPLGTFRKVAAGGQHSAGVRTDGTLDYWGEWWGGTVPTGNSFIDVAVGGEFTLALRSDGSVAAWGRNTHGQLNVPAGSYSAIVAGSKWGGAIGMTGLVTVWGIAPPILGLLAGVPVTSLISTPASLLGLRADGQLVGSTNSQPIVPAGVYVAIAGGSGQAMFAIAACFANCDFSTGTPVLTANDFQCFLDRYVAGSASANCDGTGGLTANDFQCFINKYVSGCS